LTQKLILNLLGKIVYLSFPLIACAWQGLVANMPVILHHGRPSLNKRHSFFDIWQVSGAWNTLVLTASRRQAHGLMATALTQTKMQAILGEPIMAFGDFLLALLKANQTRVHEANELISGALLYALICQKPSSVLTHPNDPWFELQALLTFFDRLKSSGWDSDFATARLPNKNDMATRLRLFGEHRLAMTRHHLYRPSDILLDSLTLLKNQPLWPGTFPQALHIQDIYPLGPGERAVLRGLKAAWPKLPIHIHYDEDFRQDDAKLSAAYEDLGLFCDEEKLFESPTVSFNPVSVYGTEAIERNIILNEVSTKLNQPQQAMAIAFAQTATAKVWWRQMADAPLSHQFNPSLAAKDFIRSNDDAVTLKDHLQPLYALRPSSILTEKWRALKAQEDLAKQKNFIESTLGQLWSDVSPVTQKLFWNSVQKNLRLSPTSGEAPLHFISLAKADGFLDRAIHVAGLNLEALMRRDQDSFIDETIAEHRDLAETLLPASYRFRLTMARLRRLAALSPNLTFSSARTDARSSPLTQLNEISNEFSIISIPVDSKKYQGKAYPIAPFQFNKNQTSFSLSALQKYLNCPQQYYLNQVLRLKEINVPEPDLRRDIKGLIIHEILEAFFKNNLSVYANAQLRPTATGALEEILDQYFLIAAQQQPDWLNFPQSTREVFRKRTLSACAGLLRKEWANFDDGKKQTLPTQTEWAFETKLPGSEFSIKGRIDRLDVTPDGGHFTVIDYKTGSSDEHGKASMQDGRAIQLPIYLYAVSKELLPKAVPTAALAYFLSDGKTIGIARKNGPDAKCLKTTQDDEVFEDIMACALEAALKAIKGIQANVFEPLPRSRKLCVDCRYVTVCPNPSPPDEESLHETD